jgi:flagellar FliJ protein
VKKFVFTLLKLKDYKVQILDIEKNILAQLNHEKNLLLMRYEQLDVDFYTLCKELKEKSKVGIMAMEVQLYQFRKDMVKQEQKEIKLKIEILDLKIEKQTAIVVSMKQEVEGLNKLEEKQLEEWETELAKETENIVSELIATKISDDVNSQKIAENVA